MSSFSESTLNEALIQIRERANALKQDLSPQLQGDGASFALALQRFLAERGVAADLYAVATQTLDSDGGLLEARGARHVMVQALGEIWDVGGFDAAERFTNEWVDEPHEVTLFQEKQISREGMMADFAARRAPFNFPESWQFLWQLRTLAAPPNDDEEHDEDPDLPPGPAM